LEIDQIARLVVDMDIHGYIHGSMDIMLAHLLIKLNSPTYVLCFSIIFHCLSFLLYFLVYSYFWVKWIISDISTSLAYVNLLPALFSFYAFAVAWATKGLYICVFMFSFLLLNSNKLNKYIPPISEGQRSIFGRGKKAISYRDCSLTHAMVTLLYRTPESTLGYNAIQRT